MRWGCLVIVWAHRPLGLDQRATDLRVCAWALMRLGVPCAPPLDRRASLPAAVVLVSAVGFAVLAPDEHPEVRRRGHADLLRGVLFCAGEGVGDRWPGADPALLALIAVIGLASGALARVARPAHTEVPAVR